jgi:hypothetical protein
MQRGMLFFVLASVAAAAGPPPAPNSLTAEERQAGWKLLFDGHSYRNWIDPARKNPPGDAWTIEDGCLKAVARPRITEDLVSRESYDDFELAWEWRISPGGNSGVKYRIQEFAALGDRNRNPNTRHFEDTVDYAIQHGKAGRDQISPGAKGQIYVIGFEFQMIDNQRNSDARRGPLYQAGGLYSLVPALRDVTRPVGEFNSSRLVVRGNHVEHWLNGEKVVDSFLNPPEVLEMLARRWGKTSPVYRDLANPRRHCPISLQNHDTEAWFRTIRIKRLR